MAVGLIGKKIKMTQLYDETGAVVPVTVIEAGPCPVTYVKTQKTDGYNALQIGYGQAKEKSLTKAEIGHLKKTSSASTSVLKELRTDTVSEYKVGQVLDVSMFAALDYVDVKGVSIGKGFQGGVKRWNWSGGPDSHGSMSHRAPGSIGSNTDPGRVWKGHHFPGRMGNDNVTVQNLEVVKVIPEENLIAVKGAIPGHTGSLVMILKAKKKLKRVVKPIAAVKAKGSGAKKNIKQKK